MVENTEQEYHGNRSDAAEGDQTETVARTVLVTSRGGETNTDGHNKRNGHRTCRHTAGVKCDCDEISRRRKGEQKQCSIEDTQQQREAQLENETAMTRKTPTPRATVQIKVSFGIEGT